MKTDSSTRFVIRTLHLSLFAFPCMMLLVFVLHFGKLTDFFNFRLHYTPTPADQIVPRLITLHNSSLLIADPHVIAYLSLPIIVLSALALFLLGWRVRPLASAAAAFITLSGIVYLGGLFAMWIALFRGLGFVDASQTSGAITTYAALSAPQSAFLLITVLAKLTMVGFIAQVLILIGTRIAPWWSILSVTFGCSLFLAFWDLDNWMLIGAVLILVGFLPLAKAVVNLQFTVSAGA
jgi:hypothetical protein